MFEENRLKLGIFVIAGVSMLVAFLFLLGIQDAMKSSFYVYTYFDSTVQGLEVGSPVKFKGVTVGAVSSISIHDNGKQIRVDMKTNPATFRSHGEQFDNYSATQLFDEMTKNGLGCEQTFTGITGMKIIEINYFKGNLAKNDGTIAPPGGEYFLPAHRSALDNSIDTVTSVIHKIGKVDFEKISKELTETIAGINKLVNRGEISEIIKSVEVSTKNVERLITKVSKKIDQVDISKISTHLNKTLSAYENLATTLDREIKSIDLDKLSKEAKLSISQVTLDIAELKESLTVTLKKGNDAIIDVQRILEDLNEDPSSLILGKQKKAIFPTK